MKSIPLTVLACLLAATGCSRSRHRAAAKPVEDHPVQNVTPVLPPSNLPSADLVTPPDVTAAPEIVPAPPIEKPKHSARKNAAANAGKSARGFEDPRRIKAGLEYNDMVRRFGPPNMRVVDGPGRTSLSYSSKKSRVQVEMENGKVLSVYAEDTGL